MLVYVIGLHAVQFGNNSNLAVRGIFEFNCFQIGQHVVLLRVNYIVHVDKI